VDRVEGWIVLGALGAMVTLSVGSLGADPWLFRLGAIEPSGPLGFLVRLAGREWDLGLIRSVAMLAGVGIVALATIGCFLRAWRAWMLVLASFAVVAALVLPATALQVGLRDSTAPWFFTNDSTYQLELAGKLVLDGENPYGHDYGSSGLERFYSLDGSVEPDTEDRQVALRHFAYFPGAALLAAGWSALPSPWDDFRVFVALATLGLLGAALVFPGPLWARLALGVVLAANPLVIRGAWFGNSDAPTLLLLVLAFALALRKRPGWSGAALGAAILTKQFALVGAPFLALMLLTESRRTLNRAALAAAGVVAAGFVPFLVADPRALWEDTVTYGAGTYRILGYGLSALLLRAGVIEDRGGAYPFFLLVALVWLPVTVLLLREQWRTRALWLGAAGFTASMFLLLFLGRVFHISYLVYPLTGLVLSGLVATAARAREPTKPLTTAQGVRSR
jgi:glycosyl transferase family 87